MDRISICPGALHPNSANWSLLFFARSLTEWDSEWDRILCAQSLCYSSEPFTVLSCVLSLLYAFHDAFHDVCCSTTVHQPLRVDRFCLRILIGEFRISNVVSLDCAMFSFEKVFFLKTVRKEFENSFQQTFRQLTWSDLSRSTPSSLYLAVVCSFVYWLLHRLQLVVNKVPNGILNKKFLSYKFVPDTIVYRVGRTDSVLVGRTALYLALYHCLPVDLYSKTL